MWVFFFLHQAIWEVIITHKKFPNSEKNENKPTIVIIPTYFFRFLEEFTRLFLILTPQRIVTN